MRTWKYVKDEVLGVLVDATMVDGFSHNELCSGRMMESSSGDQIDVLVRFDVDLLQWAGRPEAASG